MAIMKKLLGILVLGLMLSGNAFAATNLTCTSDDQTVTTEISLFIYTDDFMKESFIQAVISCYPCDKSWIMAKLETTDDRYSLYWETEKGLRASFKINRTTGRYQSIRAIDVTDPNIHYGTCIKSIPKF